MTTQTIKEHLEEVIKRKLKKDEPNFRSCWNCNGSHKHLKKVDYLIWCFSCGNYYYKGKKIK